jgi:hypothetical protein
MADYCTAPSQGFSCKLVKLPRGAALRAVVSTAQLPVKAFLLSVGAHSSFPPNMTFMSLHAPWFCSTI